MPKIYITIKSFEWCHFKNTVSFLKKIQLLLNIKNIYKLNSLKNSKFASKKSSVSILNKTCLYNVKKTFKQICFLKKRKLFTVLRSPHIDKKSREQFMFIRYKQKFFINIKNSNKIALFFFFLKNSEFPGVELEISLCYNSLIDFH